VTGKSSFGANVQTSYHPSLKGGIGSDYFQLGVGVVVKFPFKALEEPIVDHVERERLPKIKKERKRITKARPITRVETPEEREARTIRVTKEINLYAKTILFDLDKAIVKTQAEFILDNIAKIMQENEDFNFVIEGHTDNTGTPEHNLQLSQERADAIRAYLVNKGINKKRLEAKGYGLSRPLESNDTERGREINRRVEINVIPDEQHVEKTL
jgi:Outer membrane protein and related peptidoglycan-associated (lipo)proteins